MANRRAFKRSGSASVFPPKARLRVGAWGVFAACVTALLLAPPRAYPAKPKIGQLLRKVGYFYSHLHNYHIVAVRQDVYLAPRTGSSQHSVITLDKAGAGRVRLAFRDGPLNILIVSDGKTTWHYVSERKEYTERQAARLFAVPGAPESAANRNDLLGQMQNRLVGRFVRLWQLANQATLKGEAEIPFQGRKVPCYHVVFRLGRLTDQLWIDPRTFLVLREKSMQAIAAPQRRLLMNDSIQIREFSTDVTHAPGFFSFNPPPGTRRVATLNLPGINENIVGAAAGDFELKDVKGRSVRLSDFKGRTVVLSFWATWCPPCKKELPAIQRLYEQHKDAKNVVILAVDDQNKATIRNFMKEKHYTFTALVDKKRTLFKEFAVRFIPTVIVINGRGTVTAEIVGWNGPQKLLAALKKSAQ